MKTAIVFAVAIVTVSSLPFLSRENDASAEECAALNAQAAGVWMEEVDSKAVAEMTKIGDTIVAKTGEEVRVGDGTEIPEGALLLGRVTTASTHDSTTRVVFDRAQLKSGESIPIQPVTIRVDKELPKGASQR